MWSRSDLCHNRIKMAILVIFLLPFTACEKMDSPSSASKQATTGNVSLTFTPTTKDFTRAALGSYFSKLNVMVFAQDGTRAFDKVMTQTKDDADFGTIRCKLA